MDGAQTYFVSTIGTYVPGAHEVEPVAHVEECFAEWLVHNDIVLGDFVGCGGFAPQPIATVPEEKKDVLLL